MEPEDENDDLMDAYHQSMKIVEETLSKLGATVCNWLATPNVDLEPQKSVMIDHLEVILLYLKKHNTVDNGQQAGEGFLKREATFPPNPSEHSQVCHLNLPSVDYANSNLNIDHGY